MLTCESRHGVCAKCYGKNLATGRIAKMGDASGIIAAQSIGELGNQLTLRTFHTGGTAMIGQTENEITTRNAGRIEFDSIKTVAGLNAEGKTVQVVVSRTGELRIVDSKTGRMFSQSHIPYGAICFVKDGQEVERASKFAEWGTVQRRDCGSEFAGIVKYHNLEEGGAYRMERDDQTGFSEKVVIESKNKRKIPSIAIVDAKTGEELKNSLDADRRLYFGGRRRRSENRPTNRKNTA